MQVSYGKWSPFPHRILSHGRSVLRSLATAQKTERQSALHVAIFVVARLKPIILHTLVYLRRHTGWPKKLAPFFSVRLNFTKYFEVSLCNGSLDKKSQKWHNAKFIRPIISSYIRQSHWKSPKLQQVVCCRACRVCYISLRVGLRHRVSCGFASKEGAAAHHRVNVNANYCVNDLLPKLTEDRHCLLENDFVLVCQRHGTPQHRKQESCAIAKMAAQCALYMGALKIFWTP